MEEMNLSKIEPSENPIDRVIVACKDGSITSAHCAICKSKHRAHIEEMYEQKQSIQAIKNYLDDQGEKETFPPWRLNYHFKNHYQNMELQAAIIEYRDNLNEMMKRRRSALDDIDHSIAISWIELTKVLAMAAADLDRQEKKQRMIAGLQKTIKDAHEFIASRHDSEAKARATEERFAKVWMLKLENAKTDEERQLIIATLQDFKDKLQQLGDGPS
jgi:hypothetical protein